MSFEKTKQVRLWGVTSQGAASGEDLRITTGDSTGGTFTPQANPLRGTLYWDRCMYVLQDVSVAGGATGGSYTITIETDAVDGYTGLPIAQAADVGPNSATTVIMDNLHQVPSSPLPTHINIDQTAAGGAITFNCHCLARQYRGVLGSPGSRTSEHILQGTMFTGSSAGVFAADDSGVSSSSTYVLGTSGDDRGLGRMRLWDNSMYWFVAGDSIGGTHDVDIIASFGGATTSIASTGTGGAINVANEKLAIANNFYGPTPNPTQIIWTVVTAGGISDSRVVMLSKSGRGTLAKV